MADEHYLDAGEVFKIATKSLNTSQTAFRSVWEQNALSEYAQSE